jgi:hypothetical protein
MKPISAVLSARSEVIEARMDGCVAEMKGDIRALIVRMDERDARNEETFSVIRKQIINLKYIVVTTGLASVIGLYAANVATMQALLSAYDSGKSTATVFAQAAERIQKTIDRLDIMEQRIEQRISNQAVNIRQ